LDSAPETEALAQGRRRGPPTPLGP
jgi:hypothetical protein